MTELLNFAAPKSTTDYTPAELSMEIINNFGWKAPQGAMLVLKPSVSNKTAGGIVKSDAQIAEELRKMDYPMTVIATSPDALKDYGFNVNTKVVVNRFTATNLPTPIEGYDVVFVRVHEVLAYA